MALISTDARPQNEPQVRSFDCEGYISLFLAINLRSALFREFRVCRARCCQAASRKHTSAAGRIYCVSGYTLAFYKTVDSVKTCAWDSTSYEGPAVSTPADYSCSALQHAVAASMVLPWLIVGASAAFEMRRRNEPNTAERTKQQLEQKSKELEQQSKALQDRRTSLEEQYKVRKECCQLCCCVLICRRSTMLCKGHAGERGEN